jgi:PAS domain S-box-containing protein
VSARIGLSHNTIQRWRKDADFSLLVRKSVPRMMAAELHSNTTVTGDTVLQTPRDAASQLLMETALDAVIIMRSDGLVADWSKTAEEVFGWRHAEAVGRPLADLIIPSQYRRAHQVGVAHYLKTGEGPVLRKRIEISAVRRSGEEFPVELTITPVQDGPNVMFVGCIRDISSRKRAERLLEQNARRAAIFFRIAALAAETTSFEDVLSECLKAVHELTNWPLGHVYLPQGSNPIELVPSNIWHSPHPDKYQLFRDVTARTHFKSGMGLPGMIWQSGEPLWVGDVDASPLFPRAKIAGIGLKSAFGVPIRVAGQIVAILEFFSEVATEPDVDILLTVRSLAQQVGRVFERQRAEAALQEHARALETINRELNHRAKNMLAVVAGIAGQTARGSDSVEAFSENFLSRLSALGRAHSVLTARNWESTPLAQLAEEMLAPHVEPGSARLQIKGPAVEFSAKATLALSMILHELVTNAVKYGALASPNGRIALHWGLDGGPAPRVRMTWEESGVSGLTRPARLGFGSRLIEVSARHELQGSAEVSYRPAGIRYEFEFPLLSDSAAFDAATSA